MPTSLDRALNSKNTFLAFSGLVTAAAVWSIWGSDMFPVQPDPVGDPNTWTEPELRRWLAAVSLRKESEMRNLHPNPKDSREELLERVKANLRAPRA
ncbi:MAG: hypothetical protein M1818_004145 [Claussenomyces sp. TS43310]|nr:MAG: hypothetical protein M1818_004145 [Claussenomyces sp. TS43310]